MINTGVPNSLNNPQTFHSFVYLYANRSLVSLPLRVALIGAKITAGTAVNGTIYEVVDSTQTDGLFGVGSELALMCRMAFSTSAFITKGPKVFAVSVAESAGVANVKTITVTGSATADGNHIIHIAGRPFTIGVRNGDAQNTVATAIANAFKLNQQNLPVIVSVATNVVTLTHPTKGVNGADVQVVLDQQVPGSALALANTVAGTGATDHQPGLDALSSLDYDGIVFANHAAADMTEITTDLNARWSSSEKKWRWYFVGEPGTIGTATALAAAVNHQALLVASFEGCPNTAGEIATAVAMGAFSRSRPNANYNGMRLPLFPPPAATVYTTPEKETAIAAGLTPLDAVIDSTGSIVAGFSKITKMVTSRTTDAQGNPFILLRNLGVSRTGVYLARQLDVSWGDRFGADANPDGALLTDAAVDQTGDLAKSILRAAGDASIVRNVESDIGKLVLERDLVSIGRVNVDLWYTVVVGYDQVAWKHNVQV